MTTPQPDNDDRLTRFETAIVVACLLFSLAVAVGIVWLILQAIRWLMEI